MKSETGRRLTNEEAISELARVLYEGLERADPSWPPQPWDGLSADDRVFYENRIVELLKRTDLIALFQECPHL